MGYVLDPGRRLQREVRRVAAERLGGAVDLLEPVLTLPGGADDLDLETIVHEVRKRCKASRGLARLVRPALGNDFTTFDHLVRDAANELSSLRDAHAVLDTFDTLAAIDGDPRVLATRLRHEAMSQTASADAVGDDRIATACRLLTSARDASQRWKIPSGFDALGPGIAATYQRGRRGLRRARADATDERLHEWRKGVKFLWYQMQLVHDAAPSVLRPLATQLDELAETLGDDHDLAVLIELLDTRTDDYGTPRDVAHVRKLARRRQRELRERAFRSGATIYAEPDHAFVDRIGRYWHLAVELGPESAPVDAGGQTVTAPSDHVERERKFLVNAVPDDVDLTEAVEMRQGYLAADERRSVRVRDAGDCTLTIKAGAGAERTELEWTIDRDEFEAAWPHTEGQRVEKTRHRIPAHDANGSYLIELDVFGGDLDGLVVAEVEFTSNDALTAFTPPAWFGTDVTDDARYTNAALALHGLPTDPR